MKFNKHSLPFYFAVIGMSGLVAFFWVFSLSAGGYPYPISLNTRILINVVLTIIIIGLIITIYNAMKITQKEGYYETNNL